MTARNPHVTSGRGRPPKYPWHRLATSDDVIIKPYREIGVSPDRFTVRVRNWASRYGYSAHLKVLGNPMDPECEVRVRLTPR